MTITRVGTNQKYATGWDAAFSKAKPAGKAAAGAKKDKPAAAKKSPKKAAKKGKK